MKDLTKKILFIFLVLFCLTYGQTEQDSLKNVETTVLKKEISKSPWGAVLRSALLPGLGQVYNESYWKVPVIWGVFASQTYYYIQNNKAMRNWMNQYDNTNDSRYLRYRNSARDQRDQILIYGILVYFLQLVDAYVDAHLFDFDVTENTFTRQPEISLKINF